MLSRGDKIALYYFIGAVVFAVIAITNMILEVTK